MVLLRLVADGKLSSVGRNAVIVVAACGEAGIDISGLPPATGSRRIWPSLLKMKDEPSRLQLGASKCSGAMYATCRSPELTATVSSVLYSVGFVSADAGVVNSTFENTAFSMTSLSCEQTPMPT